MNKLNFTLAFLAALMTTGCSSLGLGGSSADQDSSANLGSNTQSAQVSDSDITSSIQNSFKQDPMLASSNIAVSTNQGMVSLSGRLSARAANRALSLARSAPGVRNVAWATIDYLPE